MKLEQRQKMMDRINKLEGLLAWAVKNGDEAEAERIRSELVGLVEEL